MPRLLATVAERIWAAVEPEPTSGCWLWTACVSGDGYGLISVDGGPIAAHRASYEAFVGPIPIGLCACHWCDVRLCVNPGHLFLGTRADNNRDMWDKGRGRPKEQRGCLNPSARLTEPEVVEMRRRRALGAQVKEIAQQFGVSAPTACCAIKGRTWRHVPLLSQS